MKCNEKYFNLAQRLSKKSDHNHYKFGCVIVNGKNIVGIGFNQMKSHPKSPNKWKTIHAEFHAILGVSPSDLKGSTVYVYRETKNGKVGLSKPCPDCAKILFQAGVKRVYYTTDKGEYATYKF